MILLIYLVLIIAVGVFSLLALQLLGISLPGRGQKSLPKSATGSSPVTLDGTYEEGGSPAAAVAETMAALDGATAHLKTHYPVLARMLSAYLHAEALYTEAGPEAAVKEMVLDWQAERDAVIDDITRVLAENASEDEVRAVIKSFCDLSLDEEGYRPWLIWLQGQFNSL